MPGSTIHGVPDTDLQEQVRHLLGDVNLADLALRCDLWSPFQPYKSIIAWIPACSKIKLMICSENIRFPRSGLQPIKIKGNFPSDFNKYWIRPLIECVIWSCIWNLVHNFVNGICKWEESNSISQGTLVCNGFTRESKHTLKVQC